MVSIVYFDSHMVPREHAALLLMGFGVGFVVGLTGMGGATLMTPFLILVLKVRPDFAIGTDVVYASLTKIVGAVIHWKQGLVDPRIARNAGVGQPTCRNCRGSLGVCVGPLVSRRRPLPARSHRLHADGGDRRAGPARALAQAQTRRVAERAPPRLDYGGMGC